MIRWAINKTEGRQTEIKKKERNQRQWTMEEKEENELLHKQKLYENVE